MNNGLKILLLSLVVMCFNAFISPATFSFHEYQDEEGCCISFKFLPKNNTLWAERQDLFVSSFKINFQDLSPHKIKSHFTSDHEVMNWLEGSFKKEVQYFQNALHPIYFIDVFKEEKLIGFATVEQWNGELTTLHIRKMGIAPDQASHGYGTALVDVIKNLPGVEVNRIVADTRKIYERTRRFYRKLGFTEIETPHDPELVSTGDYLGLEWKPYEKTF